MSLVVWEPKRPMEGEIGPTATHAADDAATANLKRAHAGGSLLGLRCRETGSGHADPTSTISEWDCCQERYTLW